MKIKLDENLSWHIEVPLRQLGHDLDTVFGEGLLGKSDLVVGAAARKEERILFTLDVEFADTRKHPPGKHPGIVLFRPRSQGPLTVQRMVVQFARETKLESLARCTVIVEPGRIRVRRPKG